MDQGCADPGITRRSALCGGLLALAARPARALNPNLYRLPPLWQDDRGQAFDFATLQGRWTVMTMAYGACRRICSTSLRVLQDLQALADQRQIGLQFLVVGLDPAQDRPADWAALRIVRHLTRPNWSFLTGDAAATRLMAEHLGVHYWRYGEHTMHDFKIVLVSPEGAVVRSLEAYDEPVAKLLP
jgi:cytochrome oxidase Cu insertion factor (SCO1/SenC/PrrC family)